MASGELHAEYGEHDAVELEKRSIRVKVAGRMMSRRIMGKASFIHLQDMSGRIQVFVQRDALPEVTTICILKERCWRHRRCRGSAVQNQDGELSVRCDELRLLTKSCAHFPRSFTD